MVDSIRQTGRIGKITPPGQPRPVEGRNPSRQGRHERGRDEPASEREGAPPEDKGRSSGLQSGGFPRPDSENEDRSATGQHIDVRI